MCRSGEDYIHDLRDGALTALDFLNAT